MIGLKVVLTLHVIANSVLKQCGYRNRDWFKSGFDIGVIAKSALKLWGYDNRDWFKSGFDIARHRQLGAKTVRLSQS